MTNFDSYRDILSKIRIAWNEAEEDIKLVEQVSRKVVMPSVNELRYAGRRLAEILYMMETGAPHEEAMVLYNDVKFNCLRARHDAIDSVVSKISLDADAAVSKLGYDVILKAFPNFTQLFLKLDAINKNIAKSRKNRNDREAIYATVSNSNLPDLVKLYNEFRASEPIMVGLAKNERRNKAISYLLGATGVIVAIVTGILK